MAKSTYCLYSTHFWSARNKLKKFYIILTFHLGSKASMPYYMFFNLIHVKSIINLKTTCSINDMPYSAKPSLIRLVPPSVDHDAMVMFREIPKLIVAIFEHLVLFKWDPPIFVRAWHQTCYPTFYHI